MDCSMPGFLALHYLLELAQVHVHWFGDAIQPSHPLSFPSPPAFNLSQNQDLSQRVGSSHQVAKVMLHNNTFFLLCFSVHCSLSFLPLLITYHLNEILLCHIWLVQGCSPDTCWKHQNPSLRRILEIDRSDCLEEPNFVKWEGWELFIAAGM